MARLFGGRVREALAASDAELMIHLFQDIDAGMIDRDELGIIFNGAMPWKRVIEANAVARARLPAPVASPAQPQEAPSRPDKATILRKLRAKSG